MHCTWSCLKTIHFSTELNKEEPKCTVLLQSLWQLAANSTCMLQSRTWAMESPCPCKFSFWWRSSCAASGIIASSLESGSFSCLPTRELLSKYRIILLSSIYASCWNGENVWRLIIKLFYTGKNWVAKMATKCGKSTSQNSKSTGIWLVDHPQVRALRLC